jgi:hypothetical protein
LEKYTKDPNKGYLNSDGEVVCIGLNPNKFSINRDWVVTNKKFQHRDYCSEDCYKKSKEKRWRERREKKRLKKYQDLPEYERPNGHCKICGKDITDKRADALTCCSAHRQGYNRRKK